ncbi:phosphotransferase family protein [Streptomyces sp. NPDC059037]|uniref:phosphotransferase family protein n=1 Tax=Streptomyces sp. NPDC059037 TaxID=3346710 RepID=UPI0036B1BF49
MHGDAYPGNTLWDEKDSLVRLGDWDEAAYGPRELDLANTVQGVRFGRTTAQLRAFSAAYGHDLRQWQGIATLVAIRDLHTLGLGPSFAGPIGGCESIGSTRLSAIGYRLGTLRMGDTTASWGSH